MNPVHAGFAARKVSEPAQESAVQESLIGTVHVRRTVQSQTFVSRRVENDTHPIPCVAAITAVPPPLPSGYISRQSNVAVMSICGRGQVDGLPTRVVKLGFGPTGIIARMKFPRPVERYYRLTERKTIG